MMRPVMVFLDFPLSCAHLSCPCFDPRDGQKGPILKQKILHNWGKRQNEGGHTFTHAPGENAHKNKEMIV